MVVNSISPSRLPQIPPSNTAADNSITPPISNLGFQHDMRTPRDSLMQGQNHLTIRPPSHVESPRSSALQPTLMRQFVETPELRHKATSPQRNLESINWPGDQSH